MATELARLLGSEGADVGALLDVDDENGGDIEKYVLLKDIKNVLADYDTFYTISSTTGHGAGWNKRESYCFGLLSQFSSPTLRQVVHWAIAQPHFIECLLYNSRYCSKQNIEDIGTYRIVYGDVDNFILKPSKPKEPYGTMKIDISRNVGRLLYDDGYIEGVAAEMWLGREFWRRTGASKPALEDAVEWLDQIAHLPNDVTYVCAQSEPFRSNIGHEGDLQKRLWELLFPNIRRNS